MEIQAVIYIVLTVVGMCVEAYQHGKPKDGKHNFWISILASVPIWLLLIWGGFFN